MDDFFVTKSVCVFVLKSQRQKQKQKLRNVRRNFSLGELKLTKQKITSSTIEKKKTKIM